MRIGATFYAVMPSPTDGSVWGTLRGSPGAIVRIDPATNPHRSLAEIYTVPLPGFGLRGGDIDKQGRVWVSLASGHMGVFDRRLCKGPLNGPKATGNHCPEGWAFHQYPGPGFKGIGENSAEASYYSWVDQHNTFGLGDDIPMSTANLMDGLVALNKDGKMLSIRVPYPLGFYAKGFDGRIDDPNAGWKGRGLWAANGDRTPWLIEGGKGTKPLAAHFQLRPDPLAKSGGAAFAASISSSLRPRARSSGARPLFSCARGEYGASALSHADHQPLCRPFHDWPARRRVSALFAIVGMTIWLGERAQVYFNEVIEARDTRGSAVELRNAVQAAESSQRGFLVTGNEIYLAPYDSAKALALRQLDTLQAHARPYADSEGCCRG